MDVSVVVIMVPGAGIGGLELKPLAVRLGRLGWRTAVYYRPSWRRPLADSARDLRSYCRQIPASQLHFVGHSLGGLVVLQMLADEVDPRLSRVVTLGTPHLGTKAGRRMARLPGGKWLVGEGVITANANAPLPIQGGCAVGAIAGRINLVFGWVLGAPCPNDTLIGVEETFQPGLADHLVLPVTHTSMLLSAEVVRQVDSFLRDGRFRHKGGHACHTR